MESGDQSVVDHPSIDRRSVRANRACAACRVRKQRCIISSTTGQRACQRCARHGMPCSFETEPADAHQEQPGPTKLAQMVVQLQQRLNQHEARIAELEHLDTTPRKYPRLSKSSLPIASNDESQNAMRQESNLAQTPQFFNSSMDQLELGAPIATLRSLGALGERRGLTPESARMNPHRSIPDPIGTGTLTETEASRAFNIYFEHCHPWAPVLSQKIRSMGLHLKEIAPTLFLAIVAIGARFWREDDVDRDSIRLNAMAPLKLHPHYTEIIHHLDSAISQLLLRPCAADASLSTIQTLLLYLQWMPYDPCALPPGLTRKQTSVQTRYNEMSTWAVFGLTLRYAEFCGLEQKVLGSFQDGPSTAAATSEDLDAMRVWLNMVTYDCNLTLTSGMPTSLDPRPMSPRALKFSSHPAAQAPGDVRYASMVELACIIQNVRHQKDSITERNQVLEVITAANGDFDNWQRRWFDRLGTSDFQQTQMPFTSVRWYRLALNSSLLRAVLSQTQTEMLPLPAWAIQPMTVSLTAASQILLCVSKCSFECVLALESWRPSTYPEGIFFLDPEARRSLHHAVDSTWISYTFAITFLVLCYLRKIIDENLQLCAPSHGPSFLATAWPAKPRHDSILHRISQLALQIFGCSEQASTFRPNNDYSTVVQNATSLILEGATNAEHTLVHPGNSSSIQTFFDLMEDPTWDWGISFAEEQTQWGIQL